MRLEMNWFGCQPVEKQTVMPFGEKVMMVPNRYSSEIINVFVEDLKNEDLLRSLFHYCQTVTSGKCKSLKLFFPEELPRKKLELQGFKKVDGKRLRKKHPDFSVAALPLQDEWVLQLDNHTGSAIPIHAIDLASLLFEGKQLSLDNNGEVVA